MEASGIVCEFDPLHLGHEKLLRRAKEESGLPVVCAMSGNFTQRGGAACVSKFARGEMAVHSGADLVVELPTPWAMASAETFAQGGVALLARCGVKKIYFGSECGDIAALQTVAEAVLQPELQEDIFREMRGGLSYAASRQAALEKRWGEVASLLAQPNNTLAVEYLKAIRLGGYDMTAATVLRQDGGHHGAASAGRIRRLLREGREAEAFALMPLSSAEILRRERERGEAPVDAGKLEIAVLSRLRLMEEKEFFPYDGGGEGLYRRVYRAVQDSGSVEEILRRVTTKRYPTARVRRMLWAIYLHLEKPTGEIPYVRVLAATEEGRRLLRQMRKAGVPVLTKPADVDLLGADAHRLFAQEARRTDVYGLACPTAPPKCGEDWRYTPVMI